MVDVVEAQRLVTALPNGTGKTALQNRLNGMDEVSVLDEHQLDLALTTTQATTVVLAGPIATTGAYYGISKAGVTIDGNSQTITGSLRIVANNVTLKDMTVDSGLALNATWASKHAVQVYNATGVVLNGVTLQNANVGLYVNSAAVTVNKVNTTGNGFGGIGVGKSANVEATIVPSLTVTGANTHNDASEMPHIYADVANSSWVTSNYTVIQAGNVWSGTTIVKAGQTWYKKN
ncbi:hypothetical protein [Sporosarcina sp. JAI121]|uniref:hypothetical protein n=1 Tax=Sporosarcina sp. JAI121 TaxID=2723064 RepID=UPI0015CE0C30|nr:hypothetical protein [Sporosarcina sp. JAI121]NYF23547.1 hypothetical protein [Sporosarcina sp. JAI121]